MILNTAKRIRSTVEALETRGFTQSMENSKSKDLKLSYMKIGVHDYAFVAFSTCLIAITIYIGNLF